MSKDSIKFGDKDYALVPARLKKFREENLRAKVDSNPTYNEDGSITFKTVITKDQADEYSAVGSGSARYSAEEIKKPKAFEKLETISVGRALANLGYLNDGQVATTEEMEEFEAYQLSKVDEAIEAIKKAEKRGEFEGILSKLNAEQQKQVTPIMQLRLKELKSAASNS
jgi:hypothetical protein